MSGRTQGEKLEEVHRIVVTLAVRADSVQGELQALVEKHTQTTATLHTTQTALARLEQRLSDLDQLRAALNDQKVEIAILKRDVEESKKSRDESARRLWMLAGPIAGALVGVLVGYLLRG